MGSMLSGMVDEPMEPLSPLDEVVGAFAVRAIAYASLALLLWEWGWSLQKEIELAWCFRARRPTGRMVGASWRVWLTPGVRATKWTFLASRYLALAQAIIYVALLSLQSLGACNLTRILPFGVSIVSFSAHLVMCLRIYGLISHSVLLLGSLLACALLDFGLQLGVDGFIRPVYLPITFSSGATFHTCYLIPSSNIFVLAFISPSIFHHIFLALTCWIALKHLPHEQQLIPKLRTHQAFYVLSICLVNVLNVGLVLQPRQPYKLVNFLPSLYLTQILLGRIYFALREMDGASVLGGPTSASTTSEATKHGTAAASMNKGVSFLSIGGRGQSTSRGNQSRRDAPLTDITHIRLTDMSTLEIRASPHRIINVEVQAEHGPDRVSGYGEYRSQEKNTTRQTSEPSSSISTLGSVVFVGRGLTQNHSLSPDLSTSVNDSFAFPTPPSVRSDDNVEQLGARPGHTTSPHSPSLQSRRRRSPSPLVIESVPLTSFPPKSPRRDPRPRTSSVLTSFPPIDATNLSPPNSSRIVSPRLALSPLSSAPLLPHPYASSTSPRQPGGGHGKSPSEPWALPRDLKSMPAHDVTPSGAPFLELEDEPRWEEVSLDVPATPVQYDDVEQEVGVKALRRRGISISPSALPAQTPVDATELDHGTRWY